MILLSYFPLAMVVVSGLPDHLSDDSDQYTFYLLITPWVIFWLLTIYLCVKKRQTIGKWFLKIKVIRSNGHEASLFRIVVVRNILPFSFVILVGFVEVWISVAMLLIDQLTVFGKEENSIRDYLADTKLSKQE